VKITILDIASEEEDEIIIKCHSLSDDINELICRLKQGSRKLIGYDNNGICMLEVGEIYYFDTITYTNIIRNSIKATIAGFSI
jgi:ribosomal protein L1